jgi:hygromycin-B 7''-O-kinase
VHGPGVGLGIEDADPPRPVGPDMVVHGFVDVENAVAADPMIDLAKTEYYSIHGDPAKRAGLLEGYGALPPDVEARLRLYRIYHALELWDWFAHIGEPHHLPGIAADLEAMTAG